MFVREVMTRWPVTVHRTTTVKEALRLLDEHGITSMPVVGPGGRIVGVVSEADLLRDSVPSDGRAHLMPVHQEQPEPPRYVESVMTRHSVTVSTDADLAEAVELMTSTAVKSLPVVDSQGRPVGMVSRRDVVHRLARSDETIERELDDLFRGLGMVWTATVDDGLVTIEGPVGNKARSLAETAAATVPGVRSVRLVEPSPRGGGPRVPT